MMTNHPGHLPGEIADRFRSHPFLHLKLHLTSNKRAVTGQCVGEGSPVADLKIVFQNDFLEQIMASQTNDRLAIIYFVPPDHPANSMIQALVTGWYLAITYREADGSVVHYHLSNAYINLNLRSSSTAQKPTKRI
jgi:hypothetical protein